MILDELRRLPSKTAWPERRHWHGTLGLGLVAVAWPVSWLQVSGLTDYTFFFLWLGYILAADALVLHRRGASLLAGHPAAFCFMFLASVPLWWAFEGINQFTQNWYYIGSGDWPTLKYVVVSSWHFSIVIPAVFETAQLVGTLGFVQRWQSGPKLRVSRLTLLGLMALGLVSLAALALWPRYAYPVTWLALLFIIDPLNCLWGRPSLLEQVRRGDWSNAGTFALGALVCGFFWEMWNFYAFPKWEYNIPFVEFIHVFEMPLLGYGGYLPFGLETYAAYHFLAGVVGKVRWWVVSNADSPA